MSHSDHSIRLPIQPCWPTFLQMIIQSCTLLERESRPNFEQVLQIIDNSSSKEGSSTSTEYAIPEVNVLDKDPVVTNHVNLTCDSSNPSSKSLNLAATHCTCSKDDLFIPNIRRSKVRFSQSDMLRAEQSSSKCFDVVIESNNDRISPNETLSSNDNNENNHFYSVPYVDTKTEISVPITRKKSCLKKPMSSSSSSSQDSVVSYLLPVSSSNIRHMSFCSCEIKKSREEIRRTSINDLLLQARTSREQTKVS